MNADQLIKLVQLMEETDDKDVSHHLKKALRVGVVSYTRDPKKETHGLLKDEIDCLRENPPRKIHAVKMYKDRKGCDLRTAKEDVERAMDALNIPRSR